MDAQNFGLQLSLAGLYLEKIALYSAAIIGFIFPIFYKESEQLLLLLQMFGTVIFYVIGGYVFIANFDDW